MLISQDRKAIYALLFAVFACTAVFGGSYFFASAPSFVKCQAAEAEKQDTASSDKQSGSAAIPKPQGTRAGNEATGPSNGEQDCSEDPALAKFTWQLARYTAGLFAATLALVLLGGVQLLYLGKADRVGRSVARNGIRQTRIAHRQMLISGQQTDLMEKQKEIQRKEFLITHRPRMRVRFVHGPEPTDDSAWEFRVYLANVGDATATVKSFSFGAFAIVGEDESQIEIVPVEKGIPPIEVGAGVMMRGTAKDWSSFDSVFTGQILVSGRVVYEDALGASRITAFAREKTGLDGRFRVSEKYAADEYED